MYDSHKAFYALLNKVPRISHFWNQTRHELNVAQFERELGVLSSGERQMALFFASIWFNNNSRYGFDIVDAAGRVDGHFLSIMQQWLSHPFWP